MLPTREEAERLLREAEIRNPGPWGDHSRTAAHCAERIARACGDLDPEKAYILGLLHDIGRRFGVRHLGHVSDGYSYMQSLGYDEIARVCLSHSFNNGLPEDYVGKWDTSEQETLLIREALERQEPDDYDRLIQLCDALAGTVSVLDVEARMADVKQRYGFYPQKKWDRNLALKAYFEQRMGGVSVYEVTDKDTFHLS